MINAELKEPYLETLKHLLNFYELNEKAFASTKDGVRYTPIHYENEYSGHKLSLYVQAYDLAIARSVIKSKPGYTRIQYSSSDNFRSHYYIDVDLLKLHDQLNNDNSIALLDDNQLIEAKLSMKDGVVKIKTVNKSYVLKKGLRSSGNPYKLLRYLIDKRPNEIVSLKEAKSIGINTKDLAENLRQAGLSRAVKKIFCEVHSKKYVSLSPKRLIPSQDAKDLILRIESTRNKTE